MWGFKATVSAMILAGIFFICFATPVISVTDPYEQHIECRNLEPCKEHIFGTDSLGRDIFARVCAGGRTSLTTACVCVLITTIIGCFYGGLSALYSKIDRVLMSFLEVVSSIPDILFVIALSMWLGGGSLSVVVFAISATGWYKMARLTRNLIKPLKSANYIIEAESLHKGTLYVITRHIIPNISINIISRAVLSIPEFIFYESFLSYLGIGIAPPNASWGNLISQAQRSFMFYPYQLIFTSAFLVLTLFSANWIGDSIGIRSESVMKERKKANLIRPHSIDTDVNEEKKEKNSHEILAVKNLTVRYDGLVSRFAVKCVSFSIQRGEIVGLTGQSGCGKTTIARSLSGIISLYNGIISDDSQIIYHNSKLNNTGCYKKIIQNKIAVIYQDALSVLDPTVRVGKQLHECLSLQGHYSRMDASVKIRNYLHDVGLDDHVEELLRMYPHQLSGGVAQRIVIAMAVMSEPELLICDEPTASLDYIHRRTIIQLIKQMSLEYHTAVLLISHDMTILRGVASRIMIMNDGEIVDTLFSTDSCCSDNYYTKRLIDSALISDCRPADFHTSKTVIRIEHLYYKYINCSDYVIKNVSIKIKQGEIFGILGESGSGKTTLARVTLGQLKAQSGKIWIDPSFTSAQYLFQNPLSAFDPCWRIGASITEGISENSKKQYILYHLLQKVALDFVLSERLPSEISIGQCQRAAIARALSVNPELLICDEPTSALDIVNQKMILDLLIDLNSDRKITYIFISHDLNVIRYMADRIAVMYRGRFVEVAQKDALFESPYHPYTQCLIRGTLPEMTDAHTIQSHSAPGESCEFYPVCPNRTDICMKHIPELRCVGNRTVADRHHFIACHNIPRT